jgi:hypothetical protein
MNFGFVFIILAAVCAATIGMVYIASNAQSDAPVDSFGRTTMESDNITRGNVTATMPIAIDVMGYVAIVVALLLIVMAIVAVAAKGTPSRNSRY